MGRYYKVENRWNTGEYYWISEEDMELAWKAEEEGALYSHCPLPKGPPVEIDLTTR